MIEYAPVITDHYGTRLLGQIFRPKSSRFMAPEGLPAVLVMPSALGLGDLYKSVAARLADRGFVALAADMYGEGQHFVPPQKAASVYLPLMEDPVLLRERVMIWFDALSGLDGVDAGRIAAIGYCFGGHCVLELARMGANVRAVSSFHGTLKTSQPAKPGIIRGEIAAWCGGMDPYAPMADIEALGEELRMAGASHQITVFDKAGHAFTDPDAARHESAGIAFDPMANAVSWAGTMAMLETALAS